ncbi:DNA polymerase III subunit delta' [Methylovorus sp. MM2]|uniref:DNA polymerase III subunit delta' n=1 Tax=Methylovorus sp. MM2 TaxID=1848038 RepID=UPI0007E262C6|nr:DNA polymerase III subunit delta' [Methylovorus sp. MM2]OAM53005.1 DNA polymerase III subunit delta' [Methylovorus sp. MM2]
MSEEIYPWQADIWKRLYTARDRLPHALLLRGKPGIGKLDFAIALTRALLCETPKDSGHACNQCASCNWFSQNNHPDYRLLSPEQDATSGEDDAPVPAKTSKKTQISIAQVRELGTFLELSSHRNSGRRIILVNPAEGLNQASANALLKVLEEPPQGVIFILVTHQPQRLLPTIMSRCQKIDMPVPDEQAALDWLAEKGIKEAKKRLDYAGGSPLLVLGDGESSNKLTDIWQMLARGAKLDPFALAPLCVSLGMDVAVNTMQKWIYDLVACRLAEKIRYHSHLATSLQALAKSVDLAMLLDFQRKLDEARKSANHPLNNELQLESLLLQYIQLFSRNVRA